MLTRILKARMQTLTAGHQIFCFQTKHERVNRSVFEPLVYGALNYCLFLFLLVILLINHFFFLFICFITNNRFVSRSRRRCTRILFRNLAKHYENQFTDWFKTMNRHQQRYKTISNPSLFLLFQF